MKETQPGVQAGEDQAGRITLIEKGAIKHKIHRQISPNRETNFIIISPFLQTFRLIM